MPRRDRSDGGIDAGSILSTALVDLNESGIVGSAPVTEWTNSGTGGAGYDMDVILGTGANLTAVSALGHTVVQSSGSAGLETTAGQSITSPGTVFMIAKINGTPAANQTMFHSRSSGTNIWIISTSEPATDRWFIQQGGVNKFIVEAFDNDPHLFTGQFNGTDTGKLTVSSVGSISGTMADVPWDFGTIFANNSGGSPMAGYIAQLLVFDYALSDTQITLMQTFLTAKYGL